MYAIGDILIAICALAGFLVANYIRSTKKNDVPLVCPLEGNCEAVIYSQHSKILGIPLESLGTIYYGLVALSYILFAVFPAIMPSWFIYAVLSANTLAFLLSVYLTALQAIVLKHWCTWCLLSAAICTVIFILAMITMNQEILLLFRAS